MKLKKIIQSEKNKSENRIIKGDNVEVLNLLRQDYCGKIDCIYIDPPYNNNENYVHYDDNSGFEKWLANLNEILPLLFELLSEKGSLWISIDDNELHYLKVMADKIFGRDKFIHTIVWEHRTSRENRRVFSNNHEYLLVYAKNPKVFKVERNMLSINNDFLKKFKNPDNDSRGPWQSVTLNVQAGHAVPSQFYTIVAPNGKRHDPPVGRCWIYNKEKMLEEIAKNNVWFGKDGNGVPRKKKFLSDSKKGLTPETLWTADEVGTTNKAKRYLKTISKNGQVFDTPKPEELLTRILEISTNEGDMVLDAYLGSGTTSVVSQKLNRKYIGIEIGNHIEEIVLPRLDCAIEELKKNKVPIDDLGYEFWKY